MTRKKGLALLVTLPLILMGLAMVGCSAPAVGENATSFGDSLFESQLTLSDGRTITCIVLDITNGGGLSCDWPDY